MLYTLNGCKVRMPCPCVIRLFISSFRQILKINISTREFDFLPHFYNSKEDKVNIGRITPGGQSWGLHLIVKLVSKYEGRKTSFSAWCARCQLRSELEIHVYVSNTYQRT